MTLQRARITIDADVDGDGQPETGVFEMYGNLEVNEGLNVNFLVGGRGASANNILGDFLDLGEAARRPIFIDAGGGQHTFELNFNGWEGARDAQGNPVQWGNTGNTGSPTAADATGADALTQMQVFVNYFRVAQTDSQNPATLEVGEYSSSGVLDDSLDVALRAINNVRASDQGRQFDGSVELVETQSLDRYVDALQRVSF